MTKCRIHGVTFRFRPTAAQSLELERLLEQQHGPSSPRYDTWFTPEEYGARFGLGAGDLKKVADWIVSQGSQIDYTSKSGTLISNVKPEG